MLYHYNQLGMGGLDKNLDAEITIFGTIAIHIRQNFSPDRPKPGIIMVQYILPQRFSLNSTALGYLQECIRSCNNERSIAVKADIRTQESA